MDRGLFPSPLHSEASRNEAGVVCPPLRPSLYYTHTLAGGEGGGRQSFQGPASGVWRVAEGRRQQPSVSALSPPTGWCTEGETERPSPPSAAQAETARDKKLRVACIDVHVLQVHFAVRLTSGSETRHISSLSIIVISSSCKWNFGGIKKCIHVHT